MRIRYLIEELFELPRTFLAWILFHLAAWMDMRVIPNDSGEDLIDNIWEELADVDIEELDDE